MRLVKPEQQRAEARERASARAGLNARWLVAVEETAKTLKKSRQREIAREKAIEAENAKYIYLECGHYATKEAQERNEDGKHSGLYFCEPCFENHPDFLNTAEIMEECWREPIPKTTYPPLPDKPPF